MTPPVTELPCAESMERRFQDAGGSLWRVYQRIEGDHPSLVFENMPFGDMPFENMPVARRVQHFPANWYTLPADELTILSWEH